MATVLVVSGPPGAGKSTVAHRLRDALGWPLLAKDEVKEVLFESLGWRDRAWSKRLSEASYAVMFRFARELSAAGQGSILEGNFRWSENKHRFTELAARGNVSFLQVFCTASDEVLLARWCMRIESAIRHPGHVDRESAAELAAELRDRPPQPLPLAGVPLVFDTTLEDASHLEELVAQARCRATVSHSQ